MSVDRALHFFRIGRADVERVEVSEPACGCPASRGLERVIADVGHDDDRRAAVLGDRRGHRADRTEASDGHGLPGEVDDLRRMHGIAEGIEERADAERNVRRKLDHVRRRNLHEFGEGAVLVQAVDLRADADVPVAGAALRTLAADDVHLRRDIVADVQRPFVRALGAFADLLDEAAELMSVDARRRDGLLDRRIPVIDVLVRAADRSGGDADQHFAGTGLRIGTFANCSPFRTIERSGFDDGNHCFLARSWQLAALRRPAATP